MEKIPEFLLEKLNKYYGEEYVDKIIDGFTKKRKVTLRVNTIKTNKADVEQELIRNNIEFKNSSFWDDAIIILNKQEEDIKKLEIYETGKIYMQSLSSMIPPLVLGPKENEDILDMTAAPGGKTTEIAALSNNKAHITACEMNKIRFDRLKYNLEKQGAKCVYAMQKDSRQIDDFFSFDKILLDSPCSGSGTIYINDSNLEKCFTKILIEKSIKAQKTLIKKAIKILKKGGELVYSTCSILKEENEEIIREVLKEGKLELVKIEFEKIENIPLLPVTLEKTLCVMPTEEYEGFFVAKLKKVK